MQTGGHVELTNRGYLNTVGQFVPAAGGIRVTGKWTFDLGAGDFIQVLTRTDGVPQSAPSTGEAQAGLECQATAESSLVRAYAWGATVTNATSSGSFPISAGDVVTFEMTDDGSLVTCAFVNLTKGSRATASASSTFAPAANRVSFHNREKTGTDNRGLADDLSIESGFVNRPIHHFMFEETSNITTYDLSGADNGTLGTGTLRVAGFRGQGVAFAGTNDGYVSLGSAGTTLGTADFTIGVWFRIPNTVNTIDVFGNRATTGDGNFLQIRMTPSGSVELELDEDPSGTNHQVITGGTGVDDGQWHHLAVRRQGLTLAMFVDGSIAASNTRTTGTPTDLSAGAPLRVGSSAIASAVNLLPTTGAFDDVLIYDSALKDCDISLIAARP